MPTQDDNNGDVATSTGLGSQTSLRQANEQRVLDALRGGGPLTQAELARRTTLAASTVSDIVHQLVSSGLARVEAEHGGRRGRRVWLAVEGRYLVGVDVGHAHVSVALATLSEEIVAQRSTPLPAGHDALTVLEQVQGMIEDLLTDVDARDDHTLVAAGLSIPAPVDRDGRVIGSRSVLPGWAGFDLTAVATDALGLPCRVDNDANAGVRAEARHGAGRGVDNLVYLKLGHGIGAGLLLSGDLFRGSTGTAGEIGHTTVDDGGSFCRCGNRGCLETVAAAPEVLRLIQNTHPTIDSVDKLIAAAQAGETACVRVLGDTGRAVGVAIGNLCNILNPDLVVIGGGLSAAGDLLLSPLREIVVRYGVPSAVERLRVEATTLGGQTHLLGAVGLAAEATDIDSLRR